MVEKLDNHDVYSRHTQNQELQSARLSKMCSTTALIPYFFINHYGMQQIPRYIHIHV